VGVDFVDEFVEIMFVALAEVDEGLDCLVGVCGDVLFAAFVDDLRFVSGRLRREVLGNYLDHVVDEDGEVCDAVVNIC